MTYTVILIAICDCIRHIIWVSLLRFNLYFYDSQYMQLSNHFWVIRLRFWLVFFLIVQLASIMADVNKLLQDIGKLSPADKEKISQACGGSLVKEEQDGASKFSCDLNSQARISTFSGEGNKGEVSFAQCRFEVRGLVRDKIYSEPVIVQTLRRSLRGTAADVLLHMGESVKIDEVIDKMDKVFGNILPSEAVLEQFYYAKQLAAESVAVWACRLEDILSKLKTPLFSKDVTKSMVRTKFYLGLRPGCLKN